MFSLAKCRTLKSAKCHPRKSCSNNEAQDKTLNQGKDAVQYIACIAVCFLASLPFVVLIVDRSLFPKCCTMVERLVLALLAYLSGGYVLNRKHPG